MLIGGSGTVGGKLGAACASVADIVSPPHGVLDLSSADSIATVIRECRPELILNAAAYTAVDKAESQPELAMAVNGIAPGLLAEEASQARAALIHYSTDYVFDGQATRPYRENDATAPLGVYGRSKLDGEIALRESGCAHLILRTAWIYAARGSNFLRTMLRLARDRDRLAVVDDQSGAPTSSRLIAAATAAILSRWLVSTSMQRAGYNGLYHLAAAGETSWCGFARAIVERAAHAGLIPRAPEVNAIRTEDFPTKARRPAYSVLDTAKLRERFDLFLPDWTQGLDTTIGELADMRDSLSK